jgi:integrase
MPRKSESPLKHIKTVKRNGVRYLYFNTGEKRDGKRVYSALGRADAIEFGSRYSAALAKRTKQGGRPSSLTIGQLVRRFDSSPDFTKKSLGTQKTYSVYLKRLADEFEPGPAGAIEASDIYGLMDEMGDRPAAIDMLLLAGGQMYAWAKKRKYVHHNPFTEIDRDDWETQHYQPWPEEVVEAGLNDNRLWLPVALLLYTGQRIGDCCKMRWDDITDGILHVKQQKTGKELFIPIHAELAATLARVERTNGTILTSPRGGPAKHATIRDWIKDFGEMRGLSLVPHGLRKNAVNALLEADCSTGQVSSITGQSLKMVELYAAKRNNRKMAKAAMANWERATNREKGVKTSSETADL